MTPRRPLFALVIASVLLIVLALAPPPVAAQSQMTWAVHISLAPTWFDPAEHTGIISIMKVLYAMHDALVKPMPGNAMAPSLAESWSVSKDGLAYEFVLRKGVVFQNGDPFTAEDVKFSFERYKGAAAKLLKDRVTAVEIVDPQRVRFRLKEPWPDFMTFYATPASGAAWIVPKKYVEKVGDEGFKKAPIGAGPYRLASYNPGVDLVFEAHDRYWRKAPVRQAPRVEGGPRGSDPARHAQAGRGGRGVLAARPARRGGATHARAQARAHRDLRAPSG